MEKCRKSVENIEYWLRYGHPKKYISVANHCIFAMVHKVQNRAQNTVICYWNIFLWMAISQQMLDVFDWFCICKHYFFTLFQKMKGKLGNSKKKILTLPLYSASTWAMLRRGLPKWSGDVVETYLQCLLGFLGTIYEKSHSQTALLALLLQEINFNV